MVTTELYDNGGITRAEPGVISGESADFVAKQIEKSHDPAEGSFWVNIGVNESMEARIKYLADFLKSNQKPEIGELSYSYAPLESLSQDSPKLEIYRVKRTTSRISYGGIGSAPVACNEALFATTKNGGKCWRVVQITDWKTHSGESRRFRIDKLVAQAVQYSEVK